MSNWLPVSLNYSITTVEYDNIGTNPSDTDKQPDIALQIKHG